MRIDEILRELDAISSRLAELPPEASEERRDLKERRARLRAESLQLGGPLQDRRELEARLARLEAEWERLFADHVDVVRQSGEASDFAVTAYTMNLNAAIDTAAGRERLEAEIRDIRRRLSEWTDSSSDRR